MPFNVSVGDMCVVSLQVSTLTLAVTRWRLVYQMLETKDDSKYKERKRFHRNLKVHLPLSSII